MEPNPILIIEDDDEDVLLIKDAAANIDLPHPMLYFKRGHEVHTYLTTTAQCPLFILCEVNMPVQDAFEIREQLWQNEKLICQGVPFLFWTTEASVKQTHRAYTESAQGFFIKPVSFQKLCETLQAIAVYWRYCHPLRRN